MMLFLAGLGLYQRLTIQERKDGNTKLQIAGMLLNITSLTLNNTLTTATQQEMPCIQQGYLITSRTEGRMMLYLEVLEKSLLLTAKGKISGTTPLAL